METIVEKAYAKVNLSLCITGVREDGYHLLSSVMQTVDLYDEIKVTRRKSKISLQTDNCDLPVDDTNTAYLAAKKMINFFKLNCGYCIHIKKNIPIGAGLGGPSADAAAVIRAILRLESIKASKEDLISLAVAIGADVPFLLQGGIAYCEGVGEKLTTLNSVKLPYIVLAKPMESVSTIWAYKEYDKLSLSFSKPQDELFKGIEDDNYKKICNSLYNDLEIPVFKKYPIIESIKESMTSYGADASLMSGSGSTVFGLFGNKDRAEHCKSQLEKDFNNLEIFVTTPYGGGVI